MFPGNPRIQVWDRAGAGGWWYEWPVDVHIYKFNMDNIMIIVDELPDKHSTYDQTCIWPDSWNRYDPYSKKVDTLR